MLNVLLLPTSQEIWRRPSPSSSPASKPKHPRTLFDILCSWCERYADYCDGIILAEREKIYRRDAKRLAIIDTTDKMLNALSYKEWRAAAIHLDKLEGNEEWKHDPATSDYDLAVIDAAIDDYEKMRQRGNADEMIQFLRNSLNRDLGGLDNPRLYRHSYHGTKRHIQTYLDAAVRLIEAAVQAARTLPPERVDFATSYYMVSARQNFGRTALFLSGGGTFGMCHIGVAKTLYDAGLLPRVITGASAGSIVAAVLCTTHDDRIPALLESFHEGNLDVFDSSKNPTGWIAHIARLCRGKGWTDPSYLVGVMRDMLGDLTFQEAYNRTRRVLNICISPACLRDIPAVLNYVNSPDMMIWSAVAASCAVPGVFEASEPQVKTGPNGETKPWRDDGAMCIDGSVENDVPLERVAYECGVSHFIVSQVNPHVSPFIERDYRRPGEEHPPREPVDRWYSKILPRLSVAQQLAGEEVVTRLKMVNQISYELCRSVLDITAMMEAVVTQKYTGHITITPEMAISDYFRLLSNPDPDFMKRACLAGERATWPKLHRIRDRVAIELALDDAVTEILNLAAFGQAKAVSCHECAATNEKEHRYHSRRLSGGHIERKRLFNFLQPMTKAEQAIVDDEEGHSDATNNTISSQSQTTRPQIQRPPLDRRSNSHEGSMTAEHRPQFRMTPALQHPGNFQKNSIGIDLSVPLSPAPSDENLAALRPDVAWGDPGTVSLLLEPLVDGVVGREDSCTDSDLDDGLYLRTKPSKSNITKVAAIAITTISNPTKTELTD